MTNFANFCLVQVSCDFDKDGCGFIQLTIDKFDWTLKTGSTPSSGTGPSNGHGGKGRLWFAFLV